MKKQILTDILGRHQLRFLKQLLGIYKTVLKYNKREIPSDSELQSLLRKKDIRFIVALEGDKVVGGLTAHLLPSAFGDARSFYIQDLAVAKKYQRRRIGTGLVRTLVFESRAHRHRDIFVQTSLSNKSAINFFKSRGGTPTAGFHFTQEKVIKVPKYKLFKVDGKEYYSALPVPKKGMVRL
ncbi:hypothetical protein BH10BAC4_BH10BAC4_05630 [soil metagenome]